MLPDWAQIANVRRMLPRLTHRHIPCQQKAASIDMMRPPWSVHFDRQSIHDEFNCAQKVSAEDLDVQRGVVIGWLDRLRRSAAAGALVLWVSAGPAQAGESASPWVGDGRSAVRLLSSSPTAERPAPLLAGIEIRIKPGWHTYWRYPGDAGVPPRFDFTGSDNVDAVTVEWPAPQRIPEQGLDVIGYTHDVILPLSVQPHNPDRPVKLHLKLEYAVCERLCVPAEANAELALPDAPSPYDASLAEARSRVPKKRTLGEGSTFAIRAMQREHSPPRSRAIVDVAAPPETRVDLFAEGPTAEWALPIPVPVAAPAPGVQRFAFDLDGAPPGAKYDGALITLTAVAGAVAIEVTAALH
jgi:DsbC/DsbD-like thiol-disulfide interchange protein